MPTKLKRLTFAAALLGGTALTGAAEASHFRGAAMVPSIDANGLLTVTSTSFWRPSAADGVSPVVDSDAMSQQSFVLDTSDSRFDRVVQVHTLQLPGAGAYDIASSSCCRVQGIQNGIGGNTSVSWEMNSTIVWNGSGAFTPILFNFANVQPEVVRGQAYSDNLDATSPAGLALSYALTINDPGPSFTPVPGLTLDGTGQLEIGAGDTAGLSDNDAGNDGADYMFSGEIATASGNLVEFDWLFDAVETGSNLAPVVDDVVINALVGDLITHTMTGADPNGDALTWDLVAFTGPGTPSFDNATQFFSWLSNLASPGSYIASIRASDGLLTDVGTITVNLVADGVVTTPEPEVLALFGLGLAGAGFLTRRRRNA